MLIKKKKFHNYFLEKKFSGLIFITDQRRIKDPLKIAKKLKRNSIIILRDYELEKAKKTELAFALQKISAQRGHMLLISSDINLAVKVNASGLHIPEKLYYKSIAKLNNYHKYFFISKSNHNANKLKFSKHLIDLEIISQFFVSMSHKNTTYLRFYCLLNRSRYIKKRAALGGMTCRTSKILQNSNFTGFAMISGINDFI